VLEGVGSCARLDLAKLLVVPALPDGVPTRRIEATTLNGFSSSLNRGAGESPGVARTPRGAGGAPDSAVPVLSTQRCWAPMGWSGLGRARECGLDPKENERVIVL
jgi:hypothetical protein